MKFIEAQQNMRFSYAGGGPGVLISGFVWLTSGIIAFSFSAQASLLTLFFGGMLIHPLSIVLSKMLRRTGRHEPGNPLGILAIESTALLFIGLMIAFAVAQIRIDWFFPIMLLTIGGRYGVFSTIYGMRVYWLLGALLSLSGMALVLLRIPFSYGPFVGGILEIVFSIFIVISVKTDVQVLVKKA